MMWSNRPEDERPARLTRSEFEAGAPCPGCGLPFTEPPHNGRPGTRNETPEQTAEREAEDARYKAAHPNCGSHRWRVGDGLYTHCGYCCPPHPLSADQIAAIAAIFDSERRRQRAQQP